jgi:predicted dithiol-disulfide oxidoreductase (DUF899 family)
LSLQLWTPNHDDSNSNHQPEEAGPENLPDISIFKRHADGQVYHTYSVFGSALLELVQYNFIFDLTPEGRPEGAPEMSFLKHKDAYQFPGGIY